MISLKKGKIGIILLILAILLAISVAAVWYFKYNKSDENNQNGTKNLEEEKQEEDVIAPIKKLNIFQGTDRQIAVMIDNERGAWPHSGLQDAYMIYEIIIEGGETRLMALFKNKNTAKVGPIRSARHYFVHYAMENNAIFAHFGWSPKAQSTIKQYGVNNINGIYDEYYVRIGGGYHNAFSSIKKINEFAKDKKYIQTASSEPKYKYNTEEVNLETGKKIKSLNIKYSYLHSVSYEYNENDKLFYRSMRGQIHKDRETGKQYTAKNIVILYMNNYNINDGENKGRQELENIGTGKGHYLTNGKCIDITWKKDSISSKTLWLDESGNEIVLNDGNTYVQIVPINNKVEFKLVEENKNTIE